jgi:hypothetical protein
MTRISRAAAAAAVAAAVVTGAGSLAWAAPATGTATRLSISTSPTTVTDGSSVQITGRLTETANGDWLEGADVHLFARRPGTTSWSQLAVGTTGKGGYVNFSEKPSVNLDYTLHFPGQDGFAASQSPVVEELVRPYVTATMSAHQTTVNHSVSLTGSVKPNHAGEVIYLQQATSKGWSSIAHEALSSGSAYKFVIDPVAKGTYYFRIWVPAADGNIGGASPRETLTAS